MHREELVRMGAERGYGKLLLPAAILLFFTPGPGIAANDSRPFSIELEAGPTWQSKNDVQIPNDQNGTKFSLDDLAGDGPWAGVRLNALWDITERHGVRLLLAPLSYSETGHLDKEVQFAGETYTPGSPVKGSYRFNSWRLSYRYHFYDLDRWNLWAGITAKVRDAEIRLKQDGRSSNDDDIGLVPLLYFAARYQFDNHWSVAIDLDGLAGGPGRAVDFGIKLNYALDDRYELGLGYRTLEGGVDNDDVYNFAWFNSLVLSGRVRF